MNKNWLNLYQNQNKKNQPHKHYFNLFIFLQIYFPLQYIIIYYLNKDEIKKVTKKYKKIDFKIIFICLILNKTQNPSQHLKTWTIKPYKDKISREGSGFV